MGLDQAARDGEAEPCAAGRPVARPLATGEGLLQCLACLGRDAGAVVLDPDNDAVGGALQPDAGGGAIAHRVLGEVQQDPAQRQRIAQNVEPLFGRAGQQRDRHAAPGQFSGLGPDQVGHVDQVAEILAAAAARGEQGIVEQAGHALDVGDGAVALIGVGDGLDPQAQARGEGSDIVRDAPDQCHAGLQNGGKPGLELRQGAGEGADLVALAAGFGQRHRRAGEVDPLGRPRQFRERPGFAPEGPERDQRDQRADCTGHQPDRSAEPGDDGGACRFDHQPFARVEGDLERQQLTALPVQVDRVVRTGRAGLACRGEGMARERPGVAAHQCLVGPGRGACLQGALGQEGEREGRCLQRREQCLALIRRRVLDQRHDGGDALGRGLVAEDRPGAAGVAHVRAGSGPPA